MVLAVCGLSLVGSSGCFFGFWEPVSYYDVSGTVVDGESTAPVSGAMIEIVLERAGSPIALMRDEWPVTTSTDEAGAFSVRAVAELTTGISFIPLSWIIDTSGQPEPLRMPEQAVVTITTASGMDELTLEVTEEQIEALDERTHVFIDLGTITLPGEE
jgi:hypothetical protein